MRSGVSLLVVVLLILVAAGLGAFLLLRPEPPPVSTEGDRAAGDPGPEAWPAEPPPPPVVAGVETTAAGRVVRLGSGQPIAGATVRLADLESTAGEDGRFTLGPVASGPAVVELAAEGFPPARLDVVVDADAPDLGDLALASPTALVGRVVDEKGAGIAGAAVRVLERTVVETAGWGGPAMDQIRMGVDVLDHGKPPPGIRATADAEGAFRVAGLSPGRYFLAAHAAGRASGTAEARVPEGGEAEVTIALGPGSTIEGLVDDPATGLVAGAKIVAVRWGAARNLPYERFHEARSGADGTFRVDGVEEGEAYAMFARAPDGKIGIAVRIEPPREGLRIVVGARGDIRGTVVDDETGEALEDVRVFGILGYATTDAAGDYRLEGYIRNPFLRQVWYEADGYQSHREEIGIGASLLGGSSLRVDVRLTREKPGTVVATVVDLAGRPVAGATVKVIRFGENTETLGSGVTDASGRTAIEEIPPRFVQVRASKAGYVQVQVQDHPREGPLAYPARPVWTRVEPGGRSESRLQLSPVRSLRGLVRDAGGRPLQGVTVFTNEDLGKTGEDGKFEVTGVPRDVASYVGFRAEGYLVARELVRPETRVEVVLRRGRTVTGIVVDERDAAVGGVRVRAYDTDGSQAVGESVTTGADGTFRLEGIGADEVVVRAWRKDRPPASSAAIRLGEGETREGVRIRMAKGVELRLTFEDAGGKDAGASYLLYGPLGRPAAERSTRELRWSAGADPTRLNLLPGRYRILATPLASVAGGAIETEREVTEDLALRLTFSGTARTIRLRAPADSGLIGASVTRTEPRFPEVQMWFAPDPESGLVESTALPPGRYGATVYFRREEGRGYSVETLEDLEPGGEAVEVRPPGD